MDVKSSDSASSSGSNKTKSPSKKKRQKKKIKKILTRRGYALIKTEFGFRDIHNCKKDLTVTPYVNEEFGAKPAPFTVFLESSRKLYVPKHYGLEKFGEPDKVKIEKIFNIDIEFNGSIRENQKAPVKAFLDACAPGGSYSAQSYGGILALPCGFGKTVCTLYCISVLKVKAIIVVHKEFLMSQWIERINQFLPDARVGIIQQNKVQVKNKDIVIAMLQSLSMKNYDPDIFDDFGFSIVDECHHISSQVFSRSLPKIGTKYTLGLSATPTRKDGLSKVFHWYLGPTIFSVKKREEMEVRVECIDFESDNKSYIKEELTCYGKLSMPKMINNICGYMRRTKFIIKLIEHCVKQNRKMLFLSDRRAHLTDVFNIVTAKNICSVGYYVGGMKQKERKESELKQLMLGTYTMAAEGLDVKELNTIFFASPKSDITQSIGRILRQKNPNIIPTAYDIIDKSINVFNRQAYKRIRFYKKNNYKIFRTTVKDDETQTSKKLFKQFMRNPKKVIEKPQKPGRKDDVPLKGICLL